jgi:uncharacterized protein YjbI with pentapeptide repeats
MKTSIIEMNLIEKENKYLKLKEIDIFEKNFSGAVFSGSLLDTCVLHHVTFSDCTFYASNFDACELKNCIFRNCKFIFSGINQCNLIKTQFLNCVFEVFTSKFNTLLGSDFDNQAVDAFFHDENDTRMCTLTGVKFPSY